VSDNIDRAWSDYSAHFRTRTLRLLMSSAVCLTVYSGDGSDFDVKQATEIGATLLLDKPIILVSTPGSAIPSRLRKAAYVVIEDWRPDSHDAQARLADALRKVGAS
jgi:hypothetical protein